MIVYTKTGCPWCTEVIQFLVSRDIPFEQRNVMINPEFFEEMIVKTGQVKTPTIILPDGEILADTDADALQKKLKENNLF